MSELDAAASGDKPSARAEGDAARFKSKLAVILVVGISLLVFGGGLGFQFWRTQRPPELPPDVPFPDVSELDVAAPLVEEKPVVLGKANAKAVISLFEDFRCPKCADAAETYGVVILDSIRAGQSRLEIYPLSFVDDGSRRAANAFACSRTAGFPMTYYQLLYAKNNRTLSWSDSQLLNLPKKAGITPSTSFTRCVTQNRYRNWVKSINDVAGKRKLKDPLTMFVNNQVVDMDKLTKDELRRLLREAAAK